MSKLSRRELAIYAVDRLTAGDSPKKVADSVAAVLIESRRSGEADQLVEDIVWLLEVRGHLAEAKVISAHKLSAKLQSELQKAVKNAAKVEQVNMKEEINESLLGGVLVETAVHSWDETVARRLSGMRKGI
jgi:F0F1-type ATP synthase delta subunit